MKAPKIALIGSGNIGGTLAHLLSLRCASHVVLVDVVDGPPQGKALDLTQGALLGEGNGVIQGSTDYKDCQGAEVVVVTAGFPRKPGMSREDLLEANGSVIRQVAEQLARYCPHAFVIVVTNPVDAMVGLLQNHGGFAPQKVVGMAGVLDSARYRSFLAEALQVSGQDIQGFVLGGHGDLMVPLPRYTTISGIPLKDFIESGALSEKALEDIILRTRNGGAEIVGLLQNGSAFYAPAMAVLTMIESYLYDQKRILPCAAYLQGEYGLSNVYAGVPVVIGKNGVERIIVLDLDEKEQQAFEASVAVVQKMAKELGMNA